jgi:hypothetical protein
MFSNGARHTMQYSALPWLRCFMGKFRELKEPSFMTPAEFHTLMRPIAALIGDRPLDKTLETDLNEQFPWGGSHVASIVDACEAAIQAGWMCKYEAGGIRYGRVIKADPQLNELSVDVVDMNDVRGPHHAHPNGEIDLVMPLTRDASFDGVHAGWLVYEAGSAHYPTVTPGHARVLYLLPKGAIEFTKS